MISLPVSNRIDAPSAGKYLHPCSSHFVKFGLSLFRKLSFGVVFQDSATCVLDSLQQSRSVMSLWDRS